MFDWENLRHFLAVARAGSLSGAARALQVDHATVSRRLAALEMGLQMPLIERLPRACRLTSGGVEILALAQRMEEAAFGIERHAKASLMPLQGKVTLSAPPVLVAHFLAQRLASFQCAYPQIQLSVLAQVQQVSLSRREADVALRLVRPTESSSVVRRIGRMPFALYAHKDYVALHAPADWMFIAYDGSLSDMPQQQWLLEMAGNRPIACELSDISSHLAAACTGAGVAGLPCFVGDAASQLQRIEPQERAFSRDVWLVVHRDLRRNKAVRAAMDYLAESMASVPMLAL